MGKILICNYCGESWDSEDEIVCPNCGSFSTRKEDE